MSTRIVLRTAALAATLAAAFGASAATPTVDAAYMANAEARCANLPEGYRQACLDRVHGRGESVVSVHGGGIITSSSTTAPLGTMITAPAATTTTTVTEHQAPKHKRRVVRKHVKQHKAAVAAAMPASAATKTTTTTTTTVVTPAPAKPTLTQKAVDAAKTAASAVKKAASK